MRLKRLPSSFSSDATSCGVFALTAGGGAVLAVEGDVEDRAKLLLQGHRFAHQLLAAGVVIAGREQQRLALALE
jgi:hypothetical protein